MADSAAATAGPDGDAAVVAAVVDLFHRVRESEVEEYKVSLEDAESFKKCAREILPDHRRARLVMTPDFFDALLFFAHNDWLWRNRETFASFVWVAMHIAVRGNRERARAIFSRPRGPELVITGVSRAASLVDTPSRLSLECTEAALILETVAHFVNHNAAPGSASREELSELFSGDVFPPQRWDWLQRARGVRKLEPALARVLQALWSSGAPVNVGLDLVVDTPSLHLAMLLSDSRFHQIMALRHLPLGAGGRTMGATEIAFACAAESLARSDEEMARSLPPSLRATWKEVCPALLGSGGWVNSVFHKLACAGTRGALRCAVEYTTNRELVARAVLPQKTVGPGYTLAHLAAVYGRREVYDELIQLGADPDAEDDSGITAADAAAFSFGVVLTKRAVAESDAAAAADADPDAAAADPDASDAADPDASAAESETDDTTHT
jgi:hypothetical protein